MASITDVRQASVNFMDDGSIRIWIAAPYSDELTLGTFQSGDITGKLRRETDLTIKERTVGWMIEFK